MATSIAPRLALGARTAALRLPAPLALLTWLILASAVQLVRAPGLAPWQVLWAEDGTVFLQQALDGPFLQTLGTPYAGYLHVVPRLLAEPATWFAPGAATPILAICAALTASLLAAFVWVASRSVFTTRPVRALVVVLFLFATPATFEFVGTIANLHWYGLLACFFALLHRPAGEREGAATAAVVALAALSDPMVALLLPLLLFRPGGMRRQQRGAPLIPLAALAGLSVQAVAMLASAGPGRHSAFALGDLPAVYAQRVAGPAVLGDSGFARVWGFAGAPAAWVAVALLAALLGWAAARGAAEPRRYTLLAAAGSLVLLAVPLAIRGTTELSAANGVLSGAAGRYTFIPQVLAWIAVLVLVDGRAGRGRLFPLLLVLLLAVPSGGATARSLGPGWGEGLSSARRDCATGARAASVRIAPLSGNWRVTLPCSKL
jgi:hypothetical protein